MSHFKASARVVSTEMVHLRLSILLNSTESLGQSWYDENRNNSNQPGRPIAFTVINSTNLWMDGMSWYQSQFWHSFISHSQNVTLSNIFMQSRSNSTYFTVNTDGTDTWNSRDVSFYNWTVEGGDDCIAIKGNSTNIYSKNITCIHTHGMPIGSVGQFPNRPDYVQDIWYEDVHLINSTNGAWVKAWQGTNRATSNNGDTGGGGGGWAKNVTWKNFTMENVGMPISITECVYGNDPEICDTSLVGTVADQIYARGLTEFIVPTLRSHLAGHQRHISFRCNHQPALRRQRSMPRTKVHKREHHDLELLPRSTELT